MPDLSRFDAVLFDLDGVLTPTATVHMNAWRALFTEVFAANAVSEPYTDADYFAYLDGKQRYDGVQHVLESRGLDLPYGTPDDPPDRVTVCGLGNRKNQVFAGILETDGVTAYPGSVALLRLLIARGTKVAVVSSSKNAVPVLRAAGILDEFPVIVDGIVAARDHLAGKPSPAMFDAAAHALGVPSECSVVIEDALAGVKSGANGTFGLVVGVDRGVGRAELLAAGADVVVNDLQELADDVAGGAGAGTASSPDQKTQTTQMNNRGANR